jgi:hypothetical protein
MVNEIRDPFSGSLYCSKEVEPHFKHLALGG